MITIDPDALLASDFEHITDLAREATHKLHTLDLSVQNGDVNPEQASAELRRILAPLQIRPVAQSWLNRDDGDAAGPAPGRTPLEHSPEPVNADRYFTDGSNNWRLIGGKLQVSDTSGGDWEDSCFLDVAELQSCMDVQEIPEPALLP